MENSTRDSPYKGDRFPWELMYAIIIRLWLPVFVYLVLHFISQNMSSSNLGWINQYDNPFFMILDMKPPDGLFSVAELNLSGKNSYLLLIIWSERLRSG